MNALIMLRVLAELWVPTLGDIEFKVFAYIYYTAAAAPDGRVSKSIQEIAEVTGLSSRTVRAKLNDLASSKRLDQDTEHKETENVD